MTVMRFSVIVPVLSRQTVCTAPSVSTACSRRIEHPVAAQVGDAHGEIDGGRGRQPFGHRRGRQRNGHLEHLDQPVAAHEPDPEHHAADGAAGDDAAGCPSVSAAASIGVLGVSVSESMACSLPDLGVAAGRRPPRPGPARPSPVCPCRPCCIGRRAACSRASGARGPCAPACSHRSAWIRRCSADAP